jgi:hypothetical protein
VQSTVFVQPYSKSKLGIYDAWALGSINVSGAFSSMFPYQWRFTTFSSSEALAKRGVQLPPESGLRHNSVQLQTQRYSAIVHEPLKESLHSKIL